MSKPDKPIFNQQGGRGKLYGPTHGATYMGTYQMPDGKMDRRMFNCATNKDASPRPAPIGAPTWTRESWRR